MRVSPGKGVLSLPPSRVPDRCEAAPRPSFQLMEIEPMNKLTLIFALLAALSIAGCATSGGGSSSDDNATSASSSSGSGRDALQVSDAEITSSIQQAFSQDDLLSKANISVNSNQGVVSLSGRLSARAANRAVSVARAAPGVRRVLWASIEYIPE